MKIRKVATIVCVLAAVSSSRVHAQSGDASVPSLEEMWRMIQRQQAEIDALKAENAALRGSLPAKVDAELSTGGLPSKPGADPASGVAAPPVAASAPTARGVDRAVQAENVAAAIEDGPISDEREAEPALEMNALGESSITISGHAMLDMGYQANQSNPDWFDVMRPTKLPAFENEYGDDGKFYSSVRQSRLGVSTHTPTALGDLKTLIEFELFGVGDDAGQTTFRLRHAWGELGQFGAGQYWSAFMDIDVFPNSIEYWGPNAMVFYRNVQARWTPWQTESGSRLAFSLERPGGSGDDSRLDSIIDRSDIQSDFELPDFAAHYRLADDWGHLQIAGILRQIQWVDTGDDDIDLSGDETGWGLNLSTNVKLGPHVLRASLVHGEGIQNYMNDANADIGVVLAPGSDVPVRGEAIPLTGLVAFLDLNWNAHWTSSIGYAVQDNDLPPLSAPTSFERGQYALANILYHPHPNVFFGPEIQWGKRENFDGFSADDWRIQFSAKYSFSKTLSGF